LARVADREDLLNTVVGDVQHQRNGRLAVEITDKAWFPVDFDKAASRMSSVRSWPSRRGWARAILAGAVDEVGQRRRLAAAVGVKLGVAGEQRDQDHRDRRESPPERTARAGRFASEQTV